MTCYRRTSEDAPIWLLHLESLSLARFIREEEGTPCLLGIGPNAPCETALRGLTGSLAMFLGLDEQGAQTIPMLNYQDAEWIPPEILVMHPMVDAGYFVLHTKPPVFAFGWHSVHGIVGPFWKDAPKVSKREQLLSSAFAAALPELDWQGIDKSFVECWISKPDQIAWPP